MLPSFFLIFLERKKGRGVEGKIDAERVWSWQEAVEAAVWKKGGSDEEVERGKGKILVLVPD